MKSIKIIFTPNLIIDTSIIESTWSDYIPIMYLRYDIPVTSADMSDIIMNVLYTYVEV